MARKTQRRFGAELKQRALEEEQVVEGEEAKGPIAPDGIAAPLWRRLGAYAVDLVLALFSLFVFSTQLANLELPTSQRILFIVSNIVIQIWLFGIIPTTGWAGQTLGRKLFGLYTRNVETLEYLPMWKSIMKDFGFGVFLFAFTIPLEIFYGLIQIVTKKEPAKYPFQECEIFGKKIVSARDNIFKSETIYLPKTK